MGRWSAGMVLGLMLLGACAVPEATAQVTESQDTAVTGSAADALYAAGKAAEARGDQVEMARLWRALADLGDLRGQNNLGVAYLRGYGVPQDPAEAVLWFRKAADQGADRAQYNLAQALFSGSGVAPDEKEAILWLRKSADQGFAMAQYRLFELLAAGRGMERNPGEALALLRKSAAQNYESAVLRLGVLRLRAPEDDPDDAEFLYRVALAYIAGRSFPLNVAEGMRLLREAATLNHAAAQNELGFRYLRSVAVPYNPVEAVTWFSKAAAQGHDDAQYHLGVAYKDGEGVARDDMKAYMWLSLALRTSPEGSVSRQKAFEHLATLEARLTPELRDAAQKWVDDWKPN